MTTALQSTYESNGTLVDNDDGSYTYTFSTDVTSVTSPVTVTYEPTLTHRVGIQFNINNSVNPNNPTYTFVPNGDSVSLTKTMATTATCNNCHNKLTAHGSRYDVDFCVTCHNPYTVDEDTGNNLDFGPMIHSIHSTAYRTQLEGEDGDLSSGDLDYNVYGYQENNHDYSEVTYPQSTLYCETCHQASGSQPEGDLWKTVVSAEACGSCHANGLVVVNQSATTGLAEYKFKHPAYKTSDFSGSTFPNSLCTACHNTTDGPGAWDGADIDPEGAHNQGAKYAELIGETKFLYEITNVTSTAAGENPVITFKVSNPDDSTDYDIINDTEFTASGASLNLYYAWKSGDIYNEGSGQDLGYPVRLRITDIQPNATDNGDGTFTLDTADVGSTVLPAGITDDIVVAMGGHPKYDLDGDSSVDDSVPVKGAVYYPGTARRSIVSIDSCNKCHQQLTMHGSNRTDELSLCATCHNADATDLGDHDGGTASWAAPGSDGRGEQSIHLGFMIHGIHNASIVIGDDFSEVTYPGVIKDCTTCHTGTTYYKNSGDARPVTVGSGDDAADPDDDEAISANAAMCYPCHSTTAAIAHMELNGAVIPDGDPNTCDNPGTCTTAEKGRPLKANIGATASTIESCDVCHAAGRVADIAVAHEIN